jgi:hypothetical protein
MLLLADHFYEQLLDLLMDELLMSLNAVEFLDILLVSRL